MDLIPPGENPRPAGGLDAAAIVEALMTPRGRADPYPLYVAAHELGPIAAIADGRFLVSGHAAVIRVLRDPGFGMADPGGEPAANDEAFWGLWGRCCRSDDVSTKLRRSWAVTHVRPEVQPSRLIR